MSQFYVGISSSSPLPPTVPTTFHTNDGDAVPAANIINFFANDNSNDVAAGITNTGSGNTVTYFLTNRIRGTLNTVNATPQNLIAFDLGATPALYTFKGEVQGFAAATGEGGGYFFEGTYTTNGTTSNIVGGQFSSFQETAAWAASTAFVFITDGGNNFVVQVTGIAATSINWRALFNFEKVT